MVPKFTEGDSVVVTRTFSYENTGLHWAPDMDDTVGETGTVISVEYGDFPLVEDKCSCRYEVDFGEKGCWYYWEYVLELACKHEEIDLNIINISEIF